MRAFCAKVSASNSADAGFCAGLAARDEALAKGFAAAEPSEGAANGFAWTLEGDLTPNSVSPRLTAGFALPLLLVAPVVACLFGEEVAAAAAATCVLSTLVALNPCTLPSFLLQAFRLHAQRYSLLSWPGKRSSKSPLSCSNRLINPLHTLHLANAPDGAVVVSSHVYPTLSFLSFALTVGHGVPGGRPAG